MITNVVGYSYSHLCIEWGRAPLTLTSSVGLILINLLDNDYDHCTGYNDYFYLLCSN